MSTVLSSNLELISSTCFNNKTIQLALKLANANTRRHSVAFRKRLGILLNRRECKRNFLFLDIGDYYEKEDKHAFHLWLWYSGNSIGKLIISVNLQVF
jgi:hypothetical protein